MKKWQDIVKESSLSRIQGKMFKHSAGAITAFRGDLTRKENKERNKELLSALKTKGYSVTKVKGSYIEQFGTKDAKEVGEESWFVVDDKIDGDDNGKLEKDLIALGKKYDQDSILTIRDGKGFLIGTSKRDNAFPSFGKKEPVGKGKFGKVAGEFFSRIRGRQFAFESTDPLTINGKWALKKMGERVWSEIATEALNGVKWDYSSSKKKSFPIMITEFHLDFDPRLTTILKNGIPIQSFRIVKEVINYLIGKTDILTGIEVYRSIKQKVALKRAKKICDGIGYKIIDTHDIDNQGFESPDHWISIKKK